MMDKQIILACDEKGRFSGQYLPKEAGHQGLGRKHLAIAVLLFNKLGQVLLQRRKHQIFDNVWDLTGATHLLHRKNGHNESFEEATLRCLKREYETERVGVKNLGEFNYFAKYKDGLCENEYCALMIGEYNGKVILNHKVGHEYKWMKKEEFLEDIKKNPQKYSPWANEAVKILKRTGFFN